MYALRLCKYRIYLINRPSWALIKFLDLESGRLFEVGAYNFEAAGRLLNFHHFQQVKYVCFATKQ